MKNLCFVIILTMVAVMLLLGATGIFIYGCSEYAPVFGRRLGVFIVLLFIPAIIFPAKKAIKSHKNKVLFWFAIPIVFSILVFIFSKSIYDFWIEVTAPFLHPHLPDYMIN